MTESLKTDTGEEIISFLKFDIVNTRTVEGTKKYVEYQIKVWRDNTNSDDKTGILYRRYNEFLELYTNLMKEFPDAVSSFAFPKKALYGNFSPEMISSRSASFESFLDLIASHDKMRESSPVLDFLEKKELDEACGLIRLKEYYKAINELENSFQILNKVLTFRHPRLLRLLCLMVGCCDACGDMRAPQYAHVAVRRFEAVCDTDSLRYYVPLLQLSVRLLRDSKDSQVLQDRLVSMKRRGMKVDGPSLLDLLLSDVAPLTESS